MSKILALILILLAAAVDLTLAWMISPWLAIPYTVLLGVVLFFYIKLYWSL